MWYIWYLYLFWIMIVTGYFIRLSVGYHNDYVAHWQYHSITLAAAAADNIIMVSHDIRN